MPNALSTLVLTLWPLCRIQVCLANLQQGPCHPGKALKYKEIPEAGSRQPSKSGKLLPIICRCYRRSRHFSAAPTATTSSTARRTPLLGLVDDSRAALHHLVQLGQTVECLGGAEKQVSAWLQGGVNAPENVLLHVRRKVDQHVAAEHYVELAQDRVAVQQIQGAEFDPAANGRLDGPSTRRFHIEITLQALGGQATRNRQAVVLGRLASRE